MKEWKLLDVDNINTKVKYVDVRCKDAFRKKKTDRNLISWIAFKTIGTCSTKYGTIGELRNHRAKLYKNNL